MTMDMMLASMTAEIEQRLIAQRAEHAWHRSDSHFADARDRRRLLARIGAIMGGAGRRLGRRAPNASRVAPAGQQRSAGAC